MTATRSVYSGSDGRRTPRQQRSRATVDFILEAAAQVFGARGYAATTNEIAERAGVSIGTLYQYFSNKDDLLLALAERHLDNARQQLSVALTDALVGGLAGAPADGPADALADGVADGLADTPVQRDALVRALITTVVEVNQPDELHELLYRAAPRTPALMAVLDRLRADLTAAAAGLLIADGAASEVASRRAGALVVALDAAIHEHVLLADSPQEREARTEDLVLLALAALDAFGGG